jgi:ABC-type transport system involved in multi-copper enzyme maturation permease subunit
MNRQLIAEFRKVFTIRSTYIIFAIMLALLVLLGFYVGGWHTNKIDLLDPTHLFNVDLQAINALAIFPALIGVLLFTHEFRYDMSAYTISLSNNRNKVFLAKLLVISVLSLAVTAIVGLLAPLLTKLGMNVNHVHLVYQHFYYGAIIWRGLMFGWGMSMAGLVIAAIIRNQIGAIVTLFIVPDTVEGLLSIWLKKNTVYLPFSALHQTLGAGINVANASLSHAHAMLVFLAYLFVSLTLAWLLFNKRDIA